jgi:NAD(P)-dependent dehydrogenase (short-subunit alcohol dehydrogenase family)
MPTVLITGCSTGIGFAAALELARNHHDVFASMRDPGRSPQLGALAKQEGLPLRVLRLDVDSDESVQGAVQQVLSAQGRIDALVNNAGIAELGAVEDLPLDVFRRTMETNYFGALRCIQAVLPSMRERRSGCIVNVTSVAGRISAGGHGSYSASKYALEALSEALAQEVKAFHIRVAMVEPGVIQTPIFDKLPDDPPPSQYPHAERLRSLFAASLRQPVSPGVVARRSGGSSRVTSAGCAFPWGPTPSPFSSGAPR